MTPNEAEKELNAIQANVDMGFTSMKEVKAFIARLEVVWDYVVTETHNRYEVFEKDIR